MKTSGTFLNRPNRRPPPIPVCGFSFVQSKCMETLKNKVCVQQHIRKAFVLIQCVRKVMCEYKDTINTERFPLEYIKYLIEKSALVNSGW